MRRRHSGKHVGFSAFRCFVLDLILPHPNTVSHDGGVGEYSRSPSVATYVSLFAIELVAPCGHVSFVKAYMNPWDASLPHIMMEETNKMGKVSPE